MGIWGLCMSPQPEKQHVHVSATVSDASQAHKHTHSHTHLLTLLCLFLPNYTHTLPLPPPAAAAGRAVQTHLGLQAPRPQRQVLNTCCARRCGGRAGRLLLGAAGDGSGRRCCQDQRAGRTGLCAALLCELCCVEFVWWGLVDICSVACFVA